MASRGALRILRLLVVDDHHVAREALVRRLETDERIHIVGATASSTDADRLVRDHAPHAALVDTRREDALGLQVVASLAAAPEASRPIVFLHTAFFDAEAWAAARQAGATEWILKTIDVDALFDDVSAAVMRALPRWRWDARD
jgi:DNA-binding NarL/FixJ family response regulator